MTGLTIHPISTLLILHSIRPIEILKDYSWYYSYSNTLNFIIMWLYRNAIYNKLSKLRKFNKISTTRMSFLLKTNKIQLLDEQHIERLPYEIRKTAIQEVHGY